MMGKVAQYFRDRQAGAQLSPGQAAAARGSFAVRPWHIESELEVAADLEALSDLLVSMPMVRSLLGVNVDVVVRVSDTGRGIVFQLEPQP
jgi:hypothetical protein